MTVTVKLFARARDVVGSDSMPVDLAGSHTVGDLRRAMCEHCPALKPFAVGLLFAVDAQYAGDATQISPTSDIACFPPVSGG